MRDYPPLKALGSEGAGLVGVTDLKGKKASLEMETP
eukprot:CAMPEP_0173231768 /NCGR_PEP_ID=MMETSP1142-20121109/8580_1 /TAXON_ID=483371 /ORGANISM="non described non described, Strain CCMP2298" /LENGTH=35 /DNA_ID= /DNA_START= /DNA_END= /DNA_ORIENTATION=